MLANVFLHFFAVKVDILLHRESEANTGQVRLYGEYFYVEMGMVTYGYTTKGLLLHPFTYIYHFPDNESASKMNVMVGISYLACDDSIWYRYCLALPFRLPLWVFLLTSMANSIYLKLHFLFPECSQWLYLPS